MRMLDEPEKNLARAVKLITKAAKKGANIVCLPELFTSKYFAQYKTENKENVKKFAQLSFEIITTTLAKTARDNHIILIGGSVCEQIGNKLFNTSIIFDQNGNILGKYRKIHIPYDEMFWEKDYFESGNEGFKVFKTDYGNIGILICYDQWFPEAARINALMGADIVFYPTAIGTVKGIKQTEGNWKNAWENVMRGHAISNGMFVCGVNRTGKEDKITFWGDSFVCDAFSKILKRAGKNETILVVNVDLDLCKKVRDGWHLFKDRRPKYYSKISEV